MQKPKSLEAVHTHTGNLIKKIFEHRERSYVF